MVKHLLFLSPWQMPAAKWDLSNTREGLSSIPQLISAEPQPCKAPQHHWGFLVGMGAEFFRSCCGSAPVGPHSAHSLTSMGEEAGRVKVLPKATALLYKSCLR